jgi:carboxylesterase type B
MEIGFIFGHYDDNFGGSGAAAERLSVIMQRAWAAFARSGLPAGPAPDEWPPFCPDQHIKFIG